MATFAKSTFSATSYAAFRPVYPATLFNHISAYHRGPKRLCLDLGCGPGNVTREMSRHFDRVIGTDPSKGMIEQARASIAGKAEFGYVEFQQGFAEDLSNVVEPGEVDMVVAGQAAHWFDLSRVWPELQRVVRPGGTVAFWGYGDHYFVDFPEASRLLHDCSCGTHPDKLGSYWPQPGRSYLRDQLKVVRPTAGEWCDVERSEYDPKVSWTVRQVKEYMRTWSSYHNWREAHPGQTMKSSGGQGDVIDTLFDSIASGEERFRDESNVVDVKWASALILARRV